MDELSQVLVPVPQTKLVLKLDGKPIEGVKSFTLDDKGTGIVETLDGKEHFGKILLFASYDVFIAHLSSLGDGHG